MSMTTLRLSRERAGRLLTYLQAYRRHALTQLAPSVERNTTQRVLQALQGKLIHHIDQQSAALDLLLTGEEIMALQTMVADLLQMTAKGSATEQRDACLIDLTGLKSTLEKRSIYGQRVYSTHTLL